MHVKEETNDTFTGGSSKLFLFGTTIMVPSLQIELYNMKNSCINIVA